MFSQSNTGGFGGFGTNPNPSTGTTGSVFGSGGGFGQQQQPASTGFGSGSGFGAANTTSAFGTAATPAFGGTATGGGFGQAGNAFAKPAFGTATTGGGLFGSQTAATTSNPGFGGGGGGFGVNTTTPGFGTTNTGTTGGGMFGSAAKPAFGGVTTTTGATGGGIFGTSGATTGTGAFGATAGGNTGGIGFGGADTSVLPVNGTATTPYTVTQEKEANSPMTNNFQTISFMPAYKNWSLEELRLQDYATGRRYGNSSGSTAFGFTGFGGTNTASAAAGTGFGAANTGATGGGLFGGANTQQQQTGGFGGTTGGAFGGTSNNAAGGGLFGAKPATTGGLFGASSNTGTTGGGLFGSNPAPAAGGFGNTGTAGAFGNTGGGFGAAPQPKPGFSFGGAAATTPTTGGFGTAGTGFGQQNSGTTGGLFGQQPQQQQQQQPTTGFGGQAAGAGFGATGAFGQQNAQQQPPSNFGAFGQQNSQQQKPAFGFGAPSATPATGGGLFGNQQQTQQQPGGLFGAKPAFAGATTNTTGGGLFGSNNQQPQQQQSGGLFGSAQPTLNTGGGGLFGNAQTGTTNTGGGGLFGNNQTKPGSLFTPGTGTQNTGGGLFGNLNTNTQSAGGPSPFGNQQQQQPQQQSSLFANTLGLGLGSQQQQQQFTTSIADSPYGNNLLGSLIPGQQNQLGPIATPLGSSTTKKAAMIPHHKIAPRQPALTPRLANSYSRSGSPFAASTAAITTLSGSRGSFSSNNKLSLFDGDDSALSASAFSSSINSRAASLKKLVIDKKIKDQDLFTDNIEPHVRDDSISSGQGSASPVATKGILKKTVSFDVAAENKRDGEVLATGGATPVKATSGPAPTAEELGLIRRTPERRRATDLDESPQGSAGSSSSTPALGNEVALVQQPAEERARGTYWMVPNAQKLRSYTREQQKKVIGLTVGRRGYGSVRFDHPVDITGLPCEFEDIPGTVITFDTRVCTVYPEGLEKPAPGNGLNVPAIISLEDCFPLTKNQRDKIVDPEHPRYITHIRRLKGIKDTEFIDYHPQQGVWVFKVRHFTTYGLVGGDEEEEEEMSYESSFATSQDDSLFGPNDNTPTPRPAIVTPTSLMIDDEDSMDADISGMDSTSGLEDTFDFKRLPTAVGSLARRTAPAATEQHPGSFLGEDDDGPINSSYDEDQYTEEEEGDVTTTGETFLGEGSVGSVEEDEPAEPLSEEDEAVEESTVILDDDEDTTGALNEESPQKLALMSPERSPTKSVAATPSKPLLIGKDWTEQLNNTISPVKRRFGGESFFAGSGGGRSASRRKARIEPLNYGLLDLANDLYGSHSKLNGNAHRDTGRTRKRDEFESLGDSKFGSEGVRPVARKPIASIAYSGESFDYKELEGDDQAWRKAVRPAWGPEGIIVHMGQLEALRVRKSEGSLSIAKLNFGTKPHVVPRPLELQMRFTDIRHDEYGIPFAEVSSRLLFRQFTELPWTRDPKDQHEKNMWGLASVLWDELENIPAVDVECKLYLHEKRRKELLSRFLQELVENDADIHAQSATTAEEAAFAHLTAYGIDQACSVLVDAQDFRLATLIPQLGGDRSTRQSIRSQIDHWRSKGVLSELTVPVRALYELVAGETCFSEGIKSPAEDATAPIFIGDYFSLDWKRALALKFWYGCFEEESIGRLVKRYEEDLKRFPDKVAWPTPWYLGAGKPADGRFDILWGLLRLYADSQLPLEEVLFPANIGPNKIDYRATWQLGTIFAKLGGKDFVPWGSSLSKGDQIASEYAGGLENAGLWEWSLFVVMHIQDADARGAGLKNIIGRHIDKIDDGEKREFLEKTLRIPRTWIYEAKALRARHAGDYLQEVEHLISATAWVEAHKTIIEQVAPEAVISGNLDDLKKILAKFDSSVRPEGWRLGGQVYLDYIRLQEVTKTTSSRAKTEKEEVARRLLGALKNMETCGFLQGIAVREMAGVVSSLVLKYGEMAGDKTKVLELPLTEDQYLKKTVNLSLEYYKTKLRGVTAN